MLIQAVLALWLVLVEGMFSTGVGVNEPGLRSAASRRFAVGFTLAASVHLRGLVSHIY